MLHIYVSISFPLVQTCRIHCYLHLLYRIMSICKYILHFVNKYNVPFLPSMQLPVIIGNFGFCHYAMCNIPWNKDEKSRSRHRCLIPGACVSIPNSCMYQYCHLVQVVKLKLFLCYKFEQSCMKSPLKREWEVTTVAQQTSASQEYK
jgi:hypothetical protein